MLECSDFVKASQALRPDIVLAMGDVLYGHHPGNKRVDRMGDRTQSWLRDQINGIEDLGGETLTPALFAPILPVSGERQAWYLDSLEEEFKEDISGLIAYTNTSIDAIPMSLHHLPRLSLGPCQGPHELLRGITQGLDMFAMAFVNEATDAGIALSFRFNVREDPVTEQLRPLGMNLWSPQYEVDLTSLEERCDCYACLHHHRAYIHHLLNAKEMLGWVLLQLHNYHIIDAFFENIRESISQGLFGKHHAAFGQDYEQELPLKTGQGPRVRGYEYKAEGKEPKKRNPPVYRPLNKASSIPSVRTINDLTGRMNTDDDLDGFAEMFDNLSMSR